ncbi:MAG: LON peptidase substrate-binding domain-containing protein [Halobacteriovoraceae bacterium]|nr:LON peptidase substrate-binding domain-containing protein [Halobacteriovoraceae bacterium]
MRNHRAPLLLIPNVVLYPGCTLPLYVVEPIYIKVIEDCVNNSQNIAISLASMNPHIGPTENFESNPNEMISPKRICTMGIPYILGTGPGHGIHVIIRGERRVLLTRLVQNLPYPIYELSELEETSGHGHLPQKALESLTAILHEWIDFNILDSKEKMTIKNQLHSVQNICSYICTFLIRDPELKQILLEMDDLLEKILILQVLVGENYTYIENALHKQSLFDFELLENTFPIAN